MKLSRVVRGIRFREGERGKKRETLENARRKRLEDEGKVSGEDKKGGRNVLRGGEGRRKARLFRACE